MANKSKAKGTAAETAIVNFVKERGFPARRIALAGTDDQSDVVVTDSGFFHVIESKATVKHDASSFMRQAQIQRMHFAIANGIDPLDTMPWYVWHRHGLGVSDALLVTTLGEFFREPEN